MIGSYSNSRRFAVAPSGLPNRRSSASEVPSSRFNATEVLPADNSSVPLREIRSRFSEVPVPNALKGTAALAGVPVLLAGGMAPAAGVAASVVAVAVPVQGAATLAVAPAVAAMPALVEEETVGDGVDATAKAPRSPASRERFAYL